MPDQATLFVAPGRTDSDQVLVDLEVDYTPSGVALALTLALERKLVQGIARYRATGIPLMVFDPSAGSGVFGRAVRAVLGEAAVTWGSEPRRSEVDNVRGAYGHAYGMTLLEACGDRVRLPRFDLVITNPPFEASFEEAWLQRMRDGGLLTDDATVAFLGLSQWGQSEAAYQHLKRWSPSLQIRVGGRVAFRGGGQADSREYSLWVWEADRPGLHGWETIQLPPLPADLRRWDPSAVPGTYAIEPALVERVRGLIG